MNEQTNRRTSPLHKAATFTSGDLKFNLFTKRIIRHRAAYDNND